MEQLAISGIDLLVRVEKMNRERELEESNTMRPARSVIDRRRRLAACSDKPTHDE